MHQTPRHNSIVILGSGPAGYTAAIYAARANFKPIIISGLQVGGQLMTTTEVDNWPGAEPNLQGPDLMESMKAQAERLGVTIVYDHIERVQLEEKPFRLISDQGHLYTSDVLIIATGARAKYLGLPSETTFQGKGVSACATCDGFLYRNQTVVVVGGGNTALEEALYLSRIASKTILVHRRNTFKAEKMLQDKLFKKVKEGSIELELDTVVESIQGEDGRVQAVQLKRVSTQTIFTIPVKCVFIAIGHQPNTELFQGQLGLKDGYIVLPNATSATKNKTMTTVPGVFAAGDVADFIYRQAITASGTGCMAALDAEQYLDND